MINVNYNPSFALSVEKANVLINELNLNLGSFVTVTNKFGTDVTNCFYLPVTSDQLYEIIPWEIYIDDEPCSIVVFNEINEKEALYVVAYQSKATGEIYESFDAPTLHDALYEAVVYCYNNGFIDKAHFTKGATSEDIYEITGDESNTVNISDNSVCTITQHCSACREYYTSDTSKK